MATWMTLDDLAAYLKLSRSSSYKLVQQGGLPGHKVGRTWRFDRDEIDAWVREQGRKPGGQGAR